MNRITGLPLSAQVAPYMLNAAPTQTPAPEPFVWGAGGVKLSPAQVLMQQQQAAQLSRPNYSPVGSIWEGLGRVTDNLHGAFEMRSANKQAKAQQTQNSAVAKALLDGTGGSAAIGAAYSSGDKDLVDLAGKAFDAGHPKAPNNDTVNDFNFYTQQLGQEAGQTYLQNQLDPIVSIPLPGGQTYVGPRSRMQAALEGGGPVSSPSGGGSAPPATLPPDFDFGGPTQPASGTFR